MVTLSPETLDALFPFHLILRQEEGRLRVAAAGRSLRELLGESLAGREAAELLEFDRPSIAEPTLGDLLRQVHKPFTIALKGHPVSLRGQFAPLDPSHALFLGSVNVISADTLTRAGISLSAFSPLDPTPSIVVLQRVRELQLEQLSRQYADLEKAIEQRDEFDRSANVDSLTGVLNRRGFLARASESLARGDPDGRRALLLVDVDNFKAINDTHGHAAGDTVLQVVSSRLSAEFGREGVVARWGGDEFVVLTSDPPREPASGDLDARIARVSGPLSHHGREIVPGLSVGVATSETSRNMETMIRFADLAMYEGRRGGKGRLTVFDRRLQRDLERRTTISRLLAPAIEEGEFVPHFQPIVDLRDGRLVGLEALARWHREDVGTVSPVEFIEIAEARNLMVPFDLMMVDRVAEHLVRWRAIHPHLLVHLNLSAQSFRPGIAREIRARLARRSLPPECLVIELTETSLLVNESSTRGVADELVEEGFAIELDDFGTGYSSLTHLKDIPVSGVKVDVSFVRDALPDPRTHRLLAGILHITDSLSLHSVAEGVETEEQLDMLRALGCHSAQGYLLARPLSPDDCRAMLEGLDDDGGFALAA